MLSADPCWLHRSKAYSESFGSYAWPSSLVLAHFICNHPEIVANKTVLELGAGVALPSLVAASVGAKKVYISDVSAVVAAPNCVAINGLSDRCCMVCRTLDYFDVYIPLSTFRSD